MVVVRMETANEQVVANGASYPSSVQTFCASCPKAARLRGRAQVWWTWIQGWGEFRQRLSLNTLSLNWRALKPDQPYWSRDLDG